MDFLDLVYLDAVLYGKYYRILFRLSDEIRHLYLLILFAAADLNYYSGSLGYLRTCGRALAYYLTRLHGIGWFLHLVNDKSRCGQSAVGLFKRAACYIGHGNALSSGAGDQSNLSALLYLSTRRSFLRDDHTGCYSIGLLILYLGHESDIKESIPCIVNILAHQAGHKYILCLLYGSLVLILRDDRAVRLNRFFIGCLSEELNCQYDDDRNYHYSRKYGKECCHLLHLGIVFIIVLGIVIHPVIGISVIGESHRILAGIILLIGISVRTRLVPYLIEFLVGDCSGLSVRYGVNPYDEVLIGSKQSLL